MNVEVLPPEAWASAVADRLTDRLRSSPSARVCLASGRTPEPAYQLVDPTAWGAATVFALDEFGGLPSDDPSRCAAMLERTLFGRLDPRPHIELLDPDAPSPDAECARFAGRLADGGLDLAVLGLGRNGHLGLNEPGSGRSTRTRVVATSIETASGAVQAYGAHTPPRWGMTIGIADILEAKQVWLLVTGAAKRQALRRLLDGPIGPDVPATYLHEHPDATVLVDTAAV